MQPDELTKDQLCQILNTDKLPLRETAPSAHCILKLEGKLRNIYHDDKVRLTNPPAASN